MANYSLVINSRFRPFEYQELLAPALMATQAHQAVEEAYADLSTKANIWDKMTNEATDPKAHAMYKKYADDLQSYSDQLAQYGLTPTSRQAMLNMRSRYAKEIVPIENAYKRKQEQIEEQRKALLQNPTLLLSRRAADTKLDDYLDNPDLDYESYSGALITQQVASAAANLAKEMQTQPRKWRSILGNSYYETIMQKGIPSDIISKFLYNADNIIYNNLNPEDVGIPLELSNKLRDIMEAPLASSGIRDWKNNMSKSDWKALVSKVNNHARQGLWSTVGETQYQILQNQEYLNPLQRAQLAKLKASNNEDKPTNGNKYRINPLPLRSPQEVSKNKKQIESFIKQGYLIRNSNSLILTRRGLNQLRAAHFTPPIQSWESYKKANPKASIVAYNDMVAQVKSMGNRPNQFSAWYDKNIGGYDIKTGKVSTPTTRLNRYESSIKEDSYDTYHSTEYDRQLDSNYGKEYTKQVWSAAPSKDDEKYLQGVAFNGKNGWANTKKYTKEDLKGYYISNVRYSKWGNTAYFQSDEEGKNEIIRIKLPRGIHIGVETNIRNAISNADYWGNILYKNKRPMISRNGKIVTDAQGNIIYSNTPLTEADKIDLKKKQEDALQDLYSYGSQAVVPSQTSNEIISPWY